MILNVHVYWCVPQQGSNSTGKPLRLPAPTSTMCPNIKKHRVLWGKMHMSMIMAFILQRTAYCSNLCVEYYNNIIIIIINIINPKP